MITWSQYRACVVILQVCAGYPWPHPLGRGRNAMGYALAVNAWAESRWDPAVQSGYVDGRGRREDSWGLFQLNRTAGVGRGHSVASLQDPKVNTRLIIAEALKRDRGDYDDTPRGVLSRVVTSGSVGDLVEAFCVHVERPASATEKGRERRSMAIEILGADLVAAPCLGV